MKDYRLILLLLLALETPASAALNVPLTVQEALYPGGTAGVSRTNEPFCVGVPVADSASITSTSVLGLTGAMAGQFRILGRWPSGHAKWIKVCGILSSLNAGATATVTLTDGGAGDFGGTQLASDGGASISVANGAARFSIKKANFNLIDAAVSGSTTLVAPSSASSRGLVLMGPNPAATFPANVTCGTGAGQSPCTTMYSSANDSGSTCAIEENGPVMAALRCIGNLTDNAGHVYMHHTIREFFYQGKTSVRLTVVLRNADWDTSAAPSPDAGGNTFNSAYKGMGSLEVRVNPTITGPLTYRIAAPDTGTNCSAGLCADTIGSTATYIYQGASQAWLNEFWSNSGTDCPIGLPSTCNSQLWTTDTGYKVVKDGITLTSGTQTSYPQGWADISNSSGVGMLIGIDSFAAQWPASLEFDGNGTDVRVGLYSQFNSSGAVYEPWPAWDIKGDVFLEFHTSAPASLANDFLSFQHPLLAHAAPSAYNTAAVFPYALSTAAEEDSYMAGLYPPNPNGGNAITPMSQGQFCSGGASGPCIYDLGTSVVNPIQTGGPLAVYRHWSWPDSGPRIQENWWTETNLYQWIKRGHGGRWLDSRNFYRYYASKVVMHADGTSSTDSTPNHFTWRSRPTRTQANAELDSWAQPAILNNSALVTNSSTNFIDSQGAGIALHYHDYGIWNYYFMTGDETVKESFTPMLDWFLNNDSYQSEVCCSAEHTGLAILRSIAIDIQRSAMFSEYLTTVGDTTNAAGVLAHGVNHYMNEFRPDLCVGTASGGINDSGACTPPPVNAFPASGYDAPGMNLQRGVVFSPAGRELGWCADNSGWYRGNDPFFYSRVIESLLQLRRIEGPSWQYYDESLDRAYGISQWMLSEGFSFNGSALWYDTPNSGSNTALYNGFRTILTFDQAQQCPNGTPVGLSVGSHGTAQFGGIGSVGGACVSQPGGGGPVYDCYSLGSSAAQGLFMIFYVQQLMNGKLTADQQNQFNDALVWAINQNNSYNGTADAGSYQVGSVIYGIKNPSGTTLQDIPFTLTTGSTACGTLAAGNYCVTFTPPVGTASLRVKWSPKTIVNSGGFSTASPSAPGGLLGYDPMVTQTFRLNPATYETWFGAQTTSEPAPTPGQSQSVTIATGKSGLTAANFSVKAYISGAPPAVPPPNTIPPGPPANLILVSGNNQTGTAGQPLANAFVVETTDVNGNPVAGVSVTFSVTAGGGTLSANVVTTNAQGLAASMLMLGATPGPNSVAVTSGTLAGSPVLLSAAGLAQATSTSSSTTLTWVLKPQSAGWPGLNGWETQRYDPISQQVIHYGVLPQSSSIYSSELYFYNSPTNLFTHTGGDGSATDACTANRPTWPGDRHPYSQTAVDTKRNVMWMFGGANQDCYGTSANVNGTAVTWTCCNSATFNPTWAGAQVVINNQTYTVSSFIDSQDITLTSSAGNQSNIPVILAPGYLPWTSLYALQLNANPVADTWRQLNPAHTPALQLVSTMIYDPDDDLLFAFGSDGSAQTHDNWVYCPTDLNPTPGVLTAMQSAAGCTAPDDWSQVNPTGNVQPPGVSWPEIVYDPVNKKVIQYGGGTGAVVPQNQTWAYDVPTRTWTQRCQSPCSPPPLWNGTVGGAIYPHPAMVYLPSIGQVVYHQTSGMGAPADWAYSYTTDTWTQLTSTGGGPAGADAVMAYDAANNVLVTWSYSSNGPVVWQATLSAQASPQPPPQSPPPPPQSPPPPPQSPPPPLGSNACDLNHDGTVNAADVQLAINQAVGLAPCTTADLQGNGLCNIADVQRVIAAALGGACLVGP